MLWSSHLRACLDGIVESMMLLQYNAFFHFSLFLSLLAGHGLYHGAMLQVHRDSFIKYISLVTPASRRDKINVGISPIIQSFSAKGPSNHYRLPRCMFS